MNKTKYVSPELNLKEVSKEDILNVSSESGEAVLENELILNGSSLYF